MIPGISTASFYPDHTEEALRNLCSHRVKAVEVFTNCSYELTAAYIKELRHIADSSGTRILSLHPYTSLMETMHFFSAYDRRFQEGRDLYKAYYEAACEMGADYVVFHGADKGCRLERAAYYERYGRLMEDAKAWGVELCHENVCRCVGNAPSFFTEMQRIFPDAGFVFDVKQAVRSGWDAAEFARQISGGIRHVHISDHRAGKPGQDCLPPGKGTFNIGAFLAELAENGFDGGVIVELYRENFSDIVEIMRGYQHISEVLSTIT
ncbi:sugar phosphate isomerase/epimerase [Ruminococcaceae bacterium OttesenSCG-928-L11]|nr:sugar phosphate isomerase/epimerase [Ruminococcaceae bacterium OttesenSCG-928-L11]